MTAKQAEAAAAAAEAERRRKMELISGSIVPSPADVEEGPEGFLNARRAAHAAAGSSGGDTGGAGAGKGKGNKGTVSRQPHYQAMTQTAIDIAGRPSLSFVTAAANSDRGGPSLTRIMGPWSSMRGVETNIKHALSQQRASSYDVEARLGTMVKEVGAKEKDLSGGEKVRVTSAPEQLTGSGRHTTIVSMGRGVGGPGSGAGGVKHRWRPAPIDYSRGTLDIKLARTARQAMRAVDFELYKD